jgi:aryl-alcohol dehydrogenase-like predicted oxidoreductase
VNSTGPVIVVLDDPGGARLGAGGRGTGVEEEQMQQRRIGEVEVGAVGLGAMPMSQEGRPEESRSVATIHAALDAGVTLIDTADAYFWHVDGPGHNELLIARALAGYGGDTSSVLVATKGGHTRTAGGGWDVDGRPEYLRQACEASLKRLGVEAIGLYQFHRPDPAVPFADSVGALRDLLDAGKIRMAGISNADPEQIRTAQEVLGGRLASVQNQFSPAFRSSEDELRLCDELGIAFLPWSPFGGVRRAARLGAAHSPFEEVARDRGVSPQRVCLAWMLAKSPAVIPIPGASRPETIRDSAAAAELELTGEELARLDAA